MRSPFRWTVGAVRRRAARPGLAIYMLAVCVLAASGLATTVRAQDATPSQSQQPKTVVLRVTVSDSTGAPIARADVQIADSARTLLRTVPTTDKGIAMIAGLRAGARYIIMGRKLGYAQVISAPTKLGGKDTLDVDITLDHVTALADVRVRGKLNPRYMINDKELGKHPIERMHIDEAIRRYRRGMFEGSYKMCPQIDYVYVNGVRWMANGAAFHPLEEIFASDILSARYFDCWDRDFPELRNTIVIVLKPGVEFPTRNYGEAQRKPTR